MKLMPPSPFAPWQCEQCLFKKTLRPAEMTFGSLRSGIVLSSELAAPTSATNTIAPVNVTTVRVIAAPYRSWRREKGGAKRRPFLRRSILDREGNQCRSARSLLEFWEERR